MTMQQLAEYGVLPTWDLALTVFLFLLIIFYEISSGKGRFLLTLISTYFAFVIVALFPFWERFSKIPEIKEIFYFKILFFWILTIFFAIMLSRSILGSFFTLTKRKMGDFLQTFLFSILQTGLLLAINFSFLPEEYYSKISPLVFKVFFEDFSRFIWILLPIIAIVIVKKRKEREPVEKRR